MTVSVGYDDLGAYRVTHKLEEWIEKKTKPKTNKANKQAKTNKK